MNNSPEETVKANRYLKTSKKLLLLTLIPNSFLIVGFYFSMEGYGVSFLGMLSILSLLFLIPAIIFTYIVGKSKQIQRLSLSEPEEKTVYNDQSISFICLMVLILLFYMLPREEFCFSYSRCETRIESGFDIIAIPIQFGIFLFVIRFVILIIKSFFGALFKKTN
jgi:hypothetical protein